MTLTTLVTGGQASAREAAIANTIIPVLRTAVLIEGLPDGKELFVGKPSPVGLQITRIASGCLCCTGNLIMRVSLDRILRARPDRLYIGIADSNHIENIRRFLLDSPYDEWIQLTADMKIAS